MALSANCLIGLSAENVGENPGESARHRAAEFARLAIKGIQQEFPNKPGHVWNDAADAHPPRELHPAFHGSFDWHSSVHGHWMLVRLLRKSPELADADKIKIREVLDKHLSAENIRAEAAYFDRPNCKTFERTYGWAWLLKLAEELHGWDDPDGRRWAENLRPLVEKIIALSEDYLPKQTYPIRTGVHPNTAFFLAFAWDYAQATDNKKLSELVARRSRDYFAADVDAPARWEPSGTDFFSPVLIEADLMRRVMRPGEFRAWLERFLPGLERGEPDALFTPAVVTDRSDPLLVHLDGLNLSRAWCLEGIAAALPADAPARKTLADAAARHARAGLAHVASGDYAGEHWLASFAVYLLWQ